MIVLSADCNLYGYNELVVLGRHVPVWLVAYLLENGVSDDDLLEVFVSLQHSNLSEVRQLCGHAGYRSLINSHISTHQQQTSGGIVIYADPRWVSQCHSEPSPCQGPLTCRLLDEIRNRPEDEARWQALADQLEEIGYPNWANLFRTICKYPLIDIPVLIGVAGGVVEKGRWRLGLVESVQLPLQVWERHGLQLYLENALTRVHITDRRPERFSGTDDQPRFIWTTGRRRRAGYSEQAVIPGSLFSRLIGYEAGMQNVAEFHSESAAMEALSRACLTLAGEQVHTTPRPEAFFSGRARPPAGVGT